MVRLRALAERRLLQLDEVADVRACSPTTESGRSCANGPTCAPFSIRDWRITQKLLMTTPSPIVESTMRTPEWISQPAPMTRAPLEVDAGVQDRVRAHGDVRLNPGRRRIDDRDPAAISSPFLRSFRMADMSASSFRLFTPRISPGSVTLQGFDRQAPVAEDSDQVRKIVLTLGVCRPDLLQRRKQRFEIESIDTAVDLADFPLRRRRVLVLDDRRNRAIRPDNTAVAGWLARNPPSKPWRPPGPRRGVRPAPGATPCASTGHPLTRAACCPSCRRGTAPTGAPRVRCRAGAPAGQTRWECRRRQARRGLARPYDQQ